MSSTAPTTVANTDLIQELSWQKLQYCTMVIRMAQHINMVYCNKERERELASSCWLQPFCTKGWGNETWKTSLPCVICTLSCVCNAVAVTGGSPWWQRSFPSVCKHVFSTYSLSQFSPDGVLHHHTTPLLQCYSIPPAYLCKTLSSSSYSKQKKKKNNRRKEERKRG